MEDIQAASANADSDDSSSDGGLPGRIPSLEPNLAKEKGNKAFKQGKYDKAIKCWQGGLKSILSTLCSGPQAMSDQNLSELDLTLNLNISMAYIKKGDFEGADRSVDKALARRDALPAQQITKALYRKASIQRSMHRLEECLETLKDVLEVEPGHAAAKQMQQEVDREWAKQCRDQKKNLRKLFSQLQGEDKQEEIQMRQRRAEARSKCAVKWTENDVCSEDFERGEAPACDGKDWGLALSRTFIWSIEQFAIEEAFCLSSEVQRMSVWFIGASSTCELRWLQPSTLMERLPNLESLELVLIGFLGELNPDNTRVPDPKVDDLPKGTIRTPVNKDRHVLVRAIKGSLQDALEKELKRPPVVAEGSDSGPSTSASATTTVGKEASPDPSPEPAPSDQVLHEEPELMVPPTMCFIAHPQLHRYFTDFFPAITWLIQNRVPTIIIGPTEPDPSWKQDEILLKSLGANIVVNKRINPYPMCLADDVNIKKCNHIIGFLGGKAVDRSNLTKLKLELLSQDYTVR